MIKWSLQENRGIYHVSFRIKDREGKSRQKLLSTGVHTEKRSEAEGKPKSRAQIEAEDKARAKARAKAKEIVSKWEGLIAVTDNDLLCDYIKDWVERNKPRVQITTYDGYIHMLNKYIYPYFKNLRLKVQDVKPRDIEKYCNDKKAGGLSSNTVNKHYSIIRSALWDAVKNEIIRTNPADLADKLKTVKAKHEIYKPKEIQELLKISKGTAIELPVFLAAVFGLRRSEALGLQWSAIDFDEMTLTICNKVTRGKVDGHITEVASDTLKTESSNRTYMLNEAVSNYLKSVKMRQERYVRITNKYIDYVCVNEIGEIIKPDYVTHAFNDLLAEHKMKHIRFHDLRHSCIDLVRKKCNLKLAQDYAGHADISTTGNIYSHTDLEEKLEGTDKLTELFQV